ncbi:MAG: glucoamylase family protein, partial [Luteimonas sp.]
MWNRHGILRAWLRLKQIAAVPRTAHAGSDDEQPLLAQLLSAEQMERHGKALARSHRVGTKAQSDPLLARLSDNQDVLDRACDMLNAASQANRRLTPAGEWLLDNIYLIEEQISIARRHLPKNYSRELPKLLAGPSKGLPRVYDLALNAISHGDGRVDAESLSRFIAAYQTITPLNLGELWAIPIMLRLALIENLRRISARLIEDRVDRNAADLWADRLIETAESDPKSLVLVIADMARSRPPLASSFVAELARRLQGQSSALAFPLTWIEQWLSDSEQSIEQMVQVENQQQAAAQVSVSNSIGSLRFLAMMDWREFVETMSAVEAVLRRDPDGTYGRMDFATRDRYRHIVELTARRGKLPEHDVASKVLELAQSHARTPALQESHPGERPSTESPMHATGGGVAGHVGYYLVDDGRRELEHALGVRGFTRSVRKTARRLPLLAYTVPGAVIVALFTWGILHDARPLLHPPALLWLLGFLCVIAFSELGVAVVNWVATLAVRPQALPRLDFSEGIPADARTLVVVPSMFADMASVEALAEALEVRYFANRHEHLHFALLTDFFDADQQTLPGDDALLDAAERQIEALNARHAPEGGNRFFLFHRPRAWNARERTWMGEERKRGKLAALNAYLRGGAREAFLRVAGDVDVLASVRYVITLDTDTQLPRDAAHELVGTLAHPLNRACFDQKRGVVTRGYGILQPRVGISMSGQRRSAYARLYGSEPGIDPYTRAVSDVYQDLFGEGSFIGKGIYDVDAFERALSERMPANRILSHDLLEGCYARAGLVSDVQLYEDYPSRYAVDVKRRHRWIRGDWQLLPWLLPRVPHLHARAERNPLSMLSRGKLLDNLRRSLVPASLTTLLVAGWLLSPQPLAWTLWLLAILVIPPGLASVMDLFKRPADMPLHAHLRHASTTAARTFAHVPLTVAGLPYEAFFSLDAILRTLWRMLLSRRRLLQWSPSSEVERTLGSGLAGSLRAMWSAPAFAIGVGIALLRMRPEALWVAWPLLVLWIASPVLMWWLSLTPARRDAALSAQQLRFLGKLSRRTWAFFETFVTEADHWLPPDNVQEHPVLTVARRTSPTNIGLSLLADMAAYDFGYATVGGTIERTANTLKTLQALPRHRGHFYNWYDTETLQPLPPRYVSSVDSGNLAGHLLTLRQGLLAFCDAPLLSPHTFSGLADTAALLVESRGDAPDDASLQEFRHALAMSLETSPPTLQVAIAQLEVLAKHARDIATSADELADVPANEAGLWRDKLLAQCNSALDEMVWFAPWLRSGAVIEKPLSLQSGIPLLSDIADMMPPDDVEGVPSKDITTAIDRARERIIELERLAESARDCAAMDYQFLYDRSRHLLSIGFNVDEQRVDQGYYDLLASEARLCSFVAIAQGQLPQETWFALGRLLTEVDGDPTLLSWSGSMFEYLMPQLVMPSYEGTLLDQTSKHSVARQIEYGRQRNVPWGISESGYNIVDGRMNYQYRAFGVPGLGLKRGLAQDLVIAPYASMMALMTAPDAACDNLQQMTEDGFSGRYGMYEAIDYTASRLPRGQNHALIRSFMAHHQGMGLLSLLYLLRDQPMQKRFIADPEFQATLLLLQERIPRTGAFHPHAAEVAGAATVSPTVETELRIFQTPHTARPAVQMLSNGRYHVMLSTSGGGYSRLREMAVTRWREDGTRDHWGNFCFLRDVQGGEFWSTTYQPCAVAVDHYEAIFSDAKAEFRGRKNGLEMHTEIAISPEDDIELRRLRITNRSRTTRIIEVTSYAEVVMAPAMSDDLHPAFSNLFVQTELVRSRQAIVCRRRPRAHDEATPSMFHLLAVHDADIDDISYETDRSRFIGRGNSLQRPDALTSAGALSDSEGSVLDPIVSIRVRITLQPGQSTTIDMVSGVGATREESASLIDKYRDRRLADRVFDLAWTHSQVVRRQINASQSDAQLYERLAGLILYAHPAMRAEP